MEGKKEHMRFIQDDAEEIAQWFAHGEVDVIHLNFQIQWPKKRAHKNVFPIIKFIAQYADILSDDGEIQMKQITVLCLNTVSWNFKTKDGIYMI